MSVNLDYRRYKDLFMDTKRARKIQRKYKKVCRVMNLDGKIPGTTVEVSTFRIIVYHPQIQEAIDEALKDFKPWKELETTKKEE